MMFYKIALEGRMANDKIKVQRIFCEILWETYLFQVKLSGRGDCFSMLRVDQSVVALCYGEREMRVWDLEGEDSAIFRLNSEKGYDSAERVLGLSYSSKKGPLLCFFYFFLKFLQADTFKTAFMELQVMRDWPLGGTFMGTSQSVGVAWTVCGSFLRQFHSM